MPRPLDGVKVLDLSRFLAGPYCTMLMADMGADVVKVERPGTGDETRALGPPFLGGESVYFLSINRSKRSLTLNLQNEGALLLARRLMETADVLVENFLPGKMEEFGLGYEEARRLNPRLIFCSITGYGHSGPDASLPAYDLMIQGEGGVASLTGDPDGPPYKVGVSQADIIAGMTAFQGILLALLAREKTGRGQHLDISLLDCQVALLTYQAGIYFATGESPTRMGNKHPTIAPYETYRCKDAYLNLGVGNDGQWRSFCRAVGEAAWSEDARFRTNADRVEHRLELNALIEPLLLRKTAREWVETLRAHGVPCGLVRSVQEVCDSPQIQAREMVVALDHPRAGRIRVTGTPIKLSDTPGVVENPPPLLGEHTTQVLADWLEMSAEDVEAYRHGGAF